MLLFVHSNNRQSTSCPSYSIHHNHPIIAHSIHLPYYPLFLLSKKMTWQFIVLLTSWHYHNIHFNCFFFLNFWFVHSCYNYTLLYIHYFFSSIIIIINTLNSMSLSCFFFLLNVISLSTLCMIHNICVSFFVFVYTTYVRNILISYLSTVLPTRPCHQSFNYIHPALSISNSIKTIPFFFWREHF